MRMWGKLHQFANELMAPIEEEEEEEEENTHHHQQQQLQPPASVISQQHKHHHPPKEDSFFAQPFLSPQSQPQQPQPQQQPHYPPQANVKASQTIPNSLYNNYTQPPPPQTTMMMNHSMNYQQQHQQQLPYKSYGTTSTTSSSIQNSSTPNITSRLSPVSSVSSSSLPSSFFQPSSNYYQQQVQGSADLKRVSSSSSLESSRSITPTLLTIHQVQPQQQAHGMTAKSSSSRSTTPIHMSSSANKLPEMPPGLLVDGMTKPYNETTKTDNKNYIHVKLFVGDEVLNHEKYVEYLQSHITFLQGEIVNQADRYEKEKQELKHIMENVQQAYREQNLKMNEYLEKNRRLEYDLQQANLNANTQISKLESTVNELNNQKKQLIQNINEQNQRIQQVYSELTKEQQLSKQYLNEVERLKSSQKQLEIQYGGYAVLLEERENELANLETALGQLQMASEKESSKLKQIIQKKDEEITKLKNLNTTLKQEADQVEDLKKEIEELKTKLSEQEETNTNMQELNNSQSEIVTRMLEDCMSRLNDENLVDRRVVSRMLLTLVSNIGDMTQQQAVFKFLLKTLNITSFEEEQLLQSALVYLQQERFKQLLTRKKTFSELFVTYLLEEANKPPNKP